MADIFLFLSFLQQMEPTKQAKLIKEFQKQSAQMDMTVIFYLFPNIFTM